MTHPYRAPGERPDEPAPRLSMRDALLRAAKRAVVRFDAWMNPITGFGTTRDKTTYGRVAPFVPLDDNTLSNLLHGSDMAERMVSAVPSAMLQKGFYVETGDVKVDEQIAEKFDALAIRTKLFEAIWGARGYGGGALLLGADDGQEASEPLDLDRVRDLTYVHAVDRRFLRPVAYYDDPQHPKFGQPELYAVTLAGGHIYSDSVVHESRLVIFRGATTGSQERLRLNGWDLSVLQRPHDILRQFDTGWRSVETMLTDANQAVFKMTALADIIGAEGGQEALEKRAQTMDLYRSVMRAIVVDADSQESFERQAVSFENIPQTLDKLMLRLAASVPMPVTILMGQSPAGMNATGESDFRWWYDYIDADRTLNLAPQIRRIAMVWLRSEASPVSKLPERIEVTFPNLWTPTPKEDAELRKLIADRDAIYINAQVFTPEEVALVRGQTGGYDAEIVLSDESIKAREDGLKVDLEQLAKGSMTEDEGDDIDPALDRLDAGDEQEGERDG